LGIDDLLERFIGSDGINDFSVTRRYSTRVATILEDVFAFALDFFYGPFVNRSIYAGRNEMAIVRRPMKRSNLAIVAFKISKIFKRPRIEKLNGIPVYCGENMASVAEFDLCIS
jgi:hypothetical protein